MSATAARTHPSLGRFNPGEGHVFVKPSKKINNHNDIETFLSSLAYRDITAFLLQLNRAMFPSKIPAAESKSATQNSGSSVQAWPLGSDAVEFSESVRRLQLLLTKLDSMIDEVPPDTGPRRFGNISFRKWCEEMELRAATMMDECLPVEVLNQGVHGSNDSCTAKEELMAYLKGSFGSSERLDYGTGHELSFLAFLASLWKLNVFAENEPGVEERGIVLGVIEPYFKLIRRLISTYTLEPAGSHGVWGLDDHSFIPYILGSAQLSPAVSLTDPTPVEGSLPNAPAPNDVTKAAAVARERETNMYFSAIGFIYDVKRGPFWEHSPMLYDISGIQDGWAKINKGMIKMYNAEVLSKFPVVQHFPFGSLFQWQRDPDAILPPSSTHMASGPQHTAQIPPSSSSTTYPAPDAGTRAPWANPPPGGAPQRLAQHSRNPLGATAAPWNRQSSQRQGASTDLPRTTAPWANKNSGL